jgi:ligand-binding sensor domain-containing protein
MWIGHSKGLTLFDGTYWKEIDTLETILFNREKEIFERYKDTAWVKENFKDYLLDSNSYFDAKPFVTNLTFDNSGNLWFRASDELVKYDGKNWTLYDTSNSGIKTTSISDLACDSQNNLWIGTYTNGLIKFDGTEWITYDSTNASIANRVNSISIFNDSVFVSSQKGTALFDGNHWVEIFLGVSTNNTIKDENGNYWIGSTIGLISPNRNDYRYYFSTLNSGLANNYTKSICFDFNGNLWILSNRGINIFNGDGIKDEERIINFFTTF